MIEWGVIYQCPRCDKGTHLQYEQLTISGKCENCGAYLYVDFMPVGAGIEMTVKAYPDESPACPGLL